MQEANEEVSILIVEDSSTQAEHLKYLLETNGHTVTVAVNGKEALSLLRSHKPDLIISDIIMPEMDGYQLCKEIKTDKNLKDIPVILLTVLSDPEDVLKGLECNADNFITKPYNEKYLLSRIHYILINRELRKDERVQIGVEVFFSGQKFLITSERQQILDLLLSTYEIAVQQNSELIKIRDELKALNEQLEQKVEERTAMLQVEIEERKRAELDVRKSNRALKMLSACNEALVRAETESDLLCNICRIITEVGGYRLAWVGFAEHDEEKTVKPVAQSGFDEGYLDKAKITWADTERGRGPTGKAIRSGKPCIVSDIHTNPDYLPWRDEALKHGYASSIVFPLIADGQDGKVFGALSIYASEPNTFIDQEVKILSELASDLSYGIITLRTREEHKRAEENLRFSEERYRSVVENIGIGISLISPNMEILALNKQMKTWFPCIDVSSRPICYRAFNDPPREEICSYCPTCKTLQDGQVHEAMTETPAKDKIIFFRVISSPVKDRDGKVIAAIEMVEDITERRRAETALQERIEELERFRNATIQREFRIKELKDRVKELEEKL